MFLLGTPDEDGIRAAEEEPADGGPVLRPVEQRAHREDLVEGRLAVEGVAAGEAVGLLEVDGREDLASDDRLLEARGVRGDRLRSPTRWGRGWCR